MNKLMGFYELKDMNLPSVMWKEYTGGEKLDENLLWTVRSAVYSGNDLNLPRAVGVKAVEAKAFAEELVKKLEDKGLVVYYPYFIAVKSGTIHIFPEKIIIEAVKEDLWNLVTYSDREVTVTISDSQISYDGNENFLSQEEIQELLKHIPEVKKNFRDELHTGESIMLEWSYAYNCDINRSREGEAYLVFYEIRTIA